MASMTPTAAPVRPVPVETVTPIKPSEAIRLGRLIAPLPIRGQMFGPRAACVIGAMVRGLGYEGYSDSRAYELACEALRPSGWSPLAAIGFNYDSGGTDTDAIAWLESRGL